MQKVRPDTTIYHAHKLIWIKGLDVRPGNIKILEENTALSFSDMCPQAKETEAKINKWDKIAPKSFSQ